MVFSFGKTEKEASWNSVGGRRQVMILCNQVEGGVRKGLKRGMVEQRGIGRSRVILESTSI